MNRPRAHPSVVVSIRRVFLALTPSLPPPTVVAPSTLSPRPNSSFSLRAPFGGDADGTAAAGGTQRQCPQPLRRTDSGHRRNAGAHLAHRSTAQCPALARLGSRAPTAESVGHASRAASRHPVLAMPCKELRIDSAVLRTHRLLAAPPSPTLGAGHPARPGRERLAPHGLGREYSRVAVRCARMADKRSYASLLIARELADDRLGRSILLRVGIT